MCLTAYSPSALTKDEYSEKFDKLYETDTSDIPKIMLTVGQKYMFFSNGEKITMDTKPYIKNDRTYIPLRAVCEAMNADVDFIPQTETVVIEDETLKATTVIGSNVIDVVFKDENIAPMSIETDAAAEVNADDRTMVPMRAVTESLFGCSVSWDDLNQRITVSRKYQLKRLIIETETPGDYADGLYGVEEYFGNDDGEYVVQFKRDMPEIIVKQYCDTIKAKDGVISCIPDVLMEISF